MSFQDLGRRRRHQQQQQKKKNGKYNNNNASLEMSRPIGDDEEPARIIPKKHRGVRPRLETKCPVTARTLMEDNMSLHSFSTQHSRTESPTPDDDPMIPAVTPSPMSARTQSIYAHLTREIVNYQKMVAELESLMEESGQSPEAQWRTRILIRSAQDADHDIWKRLYEYESNHGENPGYSRAQIASRKLHRDFRRVHKQLSMVLKAYEKRQHVEIAFLSREEEKKEDFFDRAMREREEEVGNIHRSMQKVNEIYSDLANLVEGQQEQIDRIENKNEDSRARTQSGLEQIQQAAWGMCGPVNASMESSKPRQGDLRVGEDFSWTMPFETISDDMRAVKEDVVKFGRDLIEDLHVDVDSSPIACSAMSFEFDNDMSEPQQTGNMRQ